MDLKVVFYVSLDENRKLAIILDNIIKGERSWTWKEMTLMMTDISESILMSIPMLDSIFPQLTNQQFINCAFLERTLALVSAYPVKPNLSRVSLRRIQGNAIAKKNVPH